MRTLMISLSLAQSSKWACVKIGGPNSPCKVTRVPSKHTHTQMAALIAKPLTSKVH